MFTQESKLAVLESKLNIYEDLSREMLTKLETAVDKISEGNSRIATILAKHDERIEQSIRNDDLFVKMIDDIKGAFEKENKKIADRLDSIETSIQNLTNFRWQVGGIAIFAVVILGVINAFGPVLLTTRQDSVSIERTK